MSHTEGHCFISTKHVNIRCLSLFICAEGICFVRIGCVESHSEGICVVSSKYGDSVCEPDESYRKPLFFKYQAC